MRNTNRFSSTNSKRGSELKANNTTTKKSQTPQWFTTIRINASHAIQSISRSLHNSQNMLEQFCLFNIFNVAQKIFTHESNVWSGLPLFSINPSPSTSHLSAVAITSLEAVK